MYRKSLHQKGLSVIFLIIGVVILGAVVITAFKALQIYKQKIGKAPEFTKNLISSQECKKQPQFTISPLKTDDLGFIIPLGRMSDSHVTPTDHQYWAPISVKRSSDYTKMPLVYDVYSPADGVITSVEEHTFIPTEKNAPKIDDWRIIINHNCGVSTIFIHLDKLSGEIARQIGKKHNSYNGTTTFEANIPIKEGQIIAKMRERSFDFSMHDENVTLPGLINPKRYEGEFWKIHTVDPFDYFAEPIRSELLKKVIRQAKPEGGKIDYDVEGKLVGNWFRQGYDPKNVNGRFWDAELTIAYNNFDPSHIFISIGNFNGRSTQAIVKGNSPDPKDVGVGQLVKYELLSFIYQNADGKEWDSDRYTPQLNLVEKESLGVLLLKLKDKNILMLETFPGKTASEVTDFTSITQIYER